MATWKAANGRNVGRLLACALALGAAASVTAGEAPRAQTCPVTIGLLRRDARGRIHVGYKNRSGRTIREVEFGADHVDARGGPPSGPLVWDSTRRLRPGRTWVRSFADPRPGPAPAGIRAWVRKVVFANGAAWTDDGSQSCSAVRLYDKEHASNKENGSRR